MLIKLYKKTQNSNHKITKRVSMKTNKSYRELLFCQHCQVQELRSELPCSQITKKTIVKTLIPFPPLLASAYTKSKIRS